MEKRKMKKVEQQIVHLPGVKSMGVIGDPGCEGLGTYNMKVYAGTLEKSAADDILCAVCRWFFGCCSGQCHADL